MNYLLVKPEELQEQGYDYKYAERIPDGRVILPLSALKVLSNFTPDIISGERLKTLIKEQQESGEYDEVVQDTEKPEEEIPGTEEPEISQEPENQEETSKEERGNE